MNYNKLIEKLRSIGVQDPTSEAHILLEHLFGVNHSDILLSKNRDYDDALISCLLNARALGTPIQYLIGSVFFCDSQIKINKHCLIPRNDTEVLCEYLIHHSPENARMLELCTGTGCIPIAILSKRPDISATAVDIVPECTSLACENRALNNISPERLEISTADALGIDVMQHLNEFDVIVSNPPYIRSDVLPSLSKEVKCEPPIALDGGSDGLKFYRLFLNSYLPMLKTDGFFAFEIGYDQADAIKKLCQPLNLNVKIIKDYSGNDRVAIISRN